MPESAEKLSETDCEVEKLEMISEPVFGKSVKDFGKSEIEDLLLLATC